MSAEAAGIICMEIVHFEAVLFPETVTAI